MQFAGDVHYRRSTKSISGKTPLLLIHGAGGSHLHWPAEIRRLVGEDIFAIDLPGHGASHGEGKDTIAAYAADVLGFMDNLGISQVVIAGHSMGSAIAQRLCVDFPERVRSLILVGAGAKLSVYPELIEFCRKESTYPQAVSLVVKWSFSPNADRRLVKLAQERMSAVPAPVLLADFTACNSFDVRDQLSEIDKLTLAICGAEDKMTPPRFSQFLVEHISHARLAIVPNAGHMVMLERPKVVAAIIKGFLEEVN